MEKIIQIHEDEEQKCPENRNQNFITYTLNITLLNITREQKPRKFHQLQCTRTR